MDFNVEGSGSMPVNENLTIKSNFAVSLNIILHYFILFKIKMI